MAPKLGEYLLQKPIGRGAMGQVWLAKQESLDRLVAVKVLPKELAKDPSFRARFEREAKTAASLVHPNVIQIYSFGIEQNVPYFAMEFVEGQDLSAWIKNNEDYSIRDAVRIVAGVARALECAAEKGMVHRDIKPGNIMIAKNNTVKVMDFGLAKAASVRSAITQPGLIMGTPAYMSPEQGMGKELDVRADMYSLGVVLYRLLTGDVPFTADTPTAVIFRHIYDPPTPVRELNPDVPEALEIITMKLLAKKPEERYPTPTALLAAIEAFLGGTTATKAAAAHGAPEAPMRTEAISQPGRTVQRTETMDVATSQPTEVTEPVMQRRDDFTSAPTMAAPPPTGFIKTGDEELEFLEDLLQSEDPGAAARATDVFEKSPGLRDHYARQQFIHALMRSQIDMLDRMGRSKRITRVLTVTGGAQSVVALTGLKAEAKPAKRRRSPMFYYCVIGGAFFILAAIIFMLFIPKMLPKGELMMIMVKNKSYDGMNRVYELELGIYAPTRRELNGTLHVQGGDKWVALLQGMTYILGSDGEITWAIPPGDFVYMYDKDGRLPSKAGSIAAELPPMAMDDILAKRGDYVMQVVGEPELPEYPGRALLELHCTRMPGAAGNRLQEARYWIEKEKGFIVQAQLQIASGPLATAKGSLTIKYVRDEPQGSGFYKYGKYQSGRKLFQGKTDGESSPWKEPSSPYGDGPAPG